MFTYAAFNSNGLIKRSTNRRKAQAHGGTCYFIAGSRRNIALAVAQLAMHWEYYAHGTRKGFISDLARSRCVDIETL